ncbi:hypothetical protein CL621_03525 [archaeon]|nr:hypothetical protein [archaeon]|tara:strand:- start:1030 stop:1332 length:303 start_codon:yes stop_codon:yes gene_type:complete
MYPKNLVDKVHQNYVDNVIPPIIEGNYTEAAIKLLDSLDYIEKKQMEIMVLVDKGANYIIALKLLYDRLKEGNKEFIETAMGLFEFYYGRTQKTEDICLN